MLDSVEALPFSAAAAHYDAGRPPYAPQALGLVADLFQIGPGVRVLDLGCGPGTLAIPFSRRGCEVVAVDPDPAMLSEGRRLAVERGGGDLQWICGRAEEVLSELGTFQLVTMGQSLHWMDRDRVLQLLGSAIVGGGGLAIFDEAPSSVESWSAVAARLVARYLGRTVRHPMKHPESAHEPSLRRSVHFAGFEEHRFETSFARSESSILSCIYSGVHSSRPMFGERADRFEAELMEALAALRPDGGFRENTTTRVLVARCSHQSPCGAASGNAGRAEGVVRRAPGD